MMKLQSLLCAILFLSVLTFNTSCEEKGPAINFNAPDTSDVPAVPTDKVVLVEEFTGVKCVNCPDGHRRLHTLEEQNNGRVLSLSIHTGFYAKPYPQSLEDYVVDDGEAIETLLGTATAFPSAGVNRVHFDGETDLIINLDKWAGKIAEELGEATLVTIDLTKSEYNPDNRTITIVAGVHFVEELTPNTVLNIAVTEDSIIDLQLDTFGIDSNYVHMNVFRGLVTPINGDEISKDIGLALKEYIYSYQIPAGYNEKHISITAYVSYETSSSEKNTLQAQRWHME